MNDDVLPQFHAKHFVWLVALFALTLYAYNSLNNSSSITANIPPINTTTTERLSEGPLITATSAVVLSADGETLFSRNDRTQYPLASLTKLLTIYTASHRLSPTSLVTIPKEAIESGPLSLVQPGEHWTVGDLITMALVASSNEAANSLCFELGQNETGIERLPYSEATQKCVELLNRTARSLGLASVYVTNPTGLDIHLGIVGGAYGTPRDIARLMLITYTDYPEVFIPSTRMRSVVTSATGRSVTVDNTNTRITDFDTLLGSKTGTTRLTGGNLAILARRSGVLYAIVLFQSGEAERFDDALILDRMIAATLSTRTK